MYGSASLLERFTNPSNQDLQPLLIVLACWRRDKSGAFAEVTAQHATDAVRFKARRARNVMLMRGGHRVDAFSR